MKDLITKSIKKVTLELIYQVVDERTKELKDETKEIKGEISEVKTEVKELRKKQEEDFRYLIQKIDTNAQKQDTSITQLNQRIDTIIQMLMELKR